MRQLQSTDGTAAHFAAKIGANKRKNDLAEITGHTGRCRACAFISFDPIGVQQGKSSKRRRDLGMLWSIDRR